LNAEMAAPVDDAEEGNEDGGTGGNEDETWKDLGLNDVR